MNASAKADPTGYIAAEELTRLSVPALSCPVQNRNHTRHRVPIIAVPVSVVALAVIVAIRKYPGC
jgi:hypothetical protein